MSSEKISVAGLGHVPETLLIPLVARARAHVLNPDLAFEDPLARNIIDLIDASPDRFSRDQATMRGCVIRAQWFDRIARNFLARHPGGLCVSLGSGLDTRAERIGVTASSETVWIDFDFEEVVALRRNLIEPRSGIESRAADLTDPSWIDTLPWSRERPVLFLSEGVMIYFQPTEAESLIRRLGGAADERSAAIELGFDYVSPFMKRHSHHATAVGKTQARYAWSLKHPNDLLHLDSKFSILENANIGRDSGMLGKVVSILHSGLTRGRHVYAATHLARLP